VIRASALVTSGDDRSLKIPQPTYPMTNSKAALDHLVAKAGRLYSLPAVAMKVLELTNNPEVDVPALKQCIENDPALTTKVLRVVNSSLFGLSREVSDLNQALALLGTKPLKLLVLGFSLPQRLFDGVAAEILGWYWRHTLTKAVAAREISETFWRQSGDEAFIAALLQDLGMLLLIQELGEPYVLFLEKVRAQGGDLGALEATSLGFDHSVLTSLLLDEWGLPDMLVEAVRRNAFDPFATSVTSSPSLPQVLHWAGLVARLLADGKADVLGDLLAQDDASHGLSHEQLHELVGNLEEKVDGLAEVLSLRLPEGRDYRDVLVEAQSQLAAVAAEAAEDLVRHQAGCRTWESGGQALLDDLQALSEAVARISQPASDPPASAPVARPAREPIAAGSPAQPLGCPSACPAPRESHRCATGRSDAVEVDPGLLGRLDDAVSACRQSHCALTLLLVELDDVDRLMITRGVEGLDRVRRFLETACQSIDHPDAICLPYRDFGFAVLLPDCERQPAVRLANRLIDHVCRPAPGRTSAARATLSISVGAATLSVPTKDFPPKDLFEGAHRCLYGSHASGGGVVKSIEIY